MKRALIVVAKRPEAGQTKTRLCPPLSPAQAAAFYRCLMLDTFALMEHIKGVQPVVAYAPDNATAYFADLAPARFRLTPQRGTDLGQRLDHVLREHLEDGYHQAVVMNSDGPTLPAAFLDQAFERLDDPTVDVILGPSSDGGYYLIGLKRPCSDLFRVTMSTSTVLKETQVRAKAAGLTTRMLPTWHDIDVWPDVDRLVSDLERLPVDQVVNTRAFLARLMPDQCGGSNAS